MAILSISTAWCDVADFRDDLKLIHLLSNTAGSSLLWVRVQCTS
jgi:hypothetical protein